MKQQSIVNPKGDMPVGVSDFAELVQDGYCFVDKTLFIQELLDSGDKVSLITRPRRFGKTINLDMLCKFFQQPAGGKGDLFEGLAIAKTGDKYLKERGKRPVLFLTFRQIKESNWNDAYTRITALLSVLAEEASRDAPLDKLPETQRITLQNVIHRKTQPAECKETLAILTKLLTLKHDGMTPWVFLDEYVRHAVARLECVTTKSHARVAPRPDCQSSGAGWVTDLY